MTETLEPLIIAIIVIGAVAYLARLFFKRREAAQRGAAGCGKASCACPTPKPDFQKR